MKKRAALISCVAFLLIPIAVRGQDLLLTNLSDLAEQAFSGGHSIYIPFAPWEWHGYSLDGGLPFWVDCSALPCSDLLPASSELRGVPLFAAVLTKNVLTGETTVQSEWSTNVIAQIPAPSGYQPGVLSEDRGVWSYWQQATNCSDCWGIEGDIAPPIVTLKILLADANDYGTYASNLEAEAEAQAAAMESSPSGFTVMTQDEGSGDGGVGIESVCTTTDSVPFYVTSIVRETNGWTTVTWQSCGDRIYGVLSADLLTPSTVYTGRAAMWGLDGSTSWTDTTTTNVDHRFYKIVRMLPDGDFDGDGLSNAFELQYGFDPLNSFDAAGDLDGDGYSNWDEMLMGTSPVATNDLVTVYVDSMNTNGLWDGTQAHPFRYIQDAMQCSVNVNSNLAIRVRPGEYYETVSNEHYDFYGNELSRRKYVYIYAANDDWSLSTDPDTHIIDSSHLPYNDVLGNPFGSAPAVEFFAVSRSRINGFTIRGGEGYSILAGGYYGAGILAYSASGPIFISNCIVKKNGSFGNAGAGGIFIQAATNSLIYNTVVTDNLGFEAGGIDDYGGVRIWNCTVINNHSDTVGGIYGFDTSNSSIRNCAIWGNGLDVALADVDYSSFGSNTLIVAGSHNLTNDPVLVNAVFGNYRLQTNSTMIAAGTNLPIERRDLYGNSRPITGVFDIGANEFTDSDGDGMQDDWEIKHSLNAFNSGDASGNPDGDGFNNLDEYNHNTDPQNGDSDGDGIPDDQDSDPTTPDEQITIEWHDPLHGSVWKYWVNQTNNTAWINNPPTQPRILKLNNYHIGDEFFIQLSYDSGPTNTIYFLVPLQSDGAISVVPDPGATPILNLTDAAPIGQRTPPDPGWKTRVWHAPSTNVDVCAGFDNETPKIYYGPGYYNALSVPQGGTNSFTVNIKPSTIITQVIFQIDKPTLASVIPTTATTGTQTVLVAGLATGNAITNARLNTLAVGAQNSYTTLASRVEIDVLPVSTTVTVAVWAVTATGETGTAPTNAPTQSQLKSYLDTVYGKQANVFMNVLPLTNIVANYDLNTNGVLTIATNSANQLSAEQAAITNAAFRNGAINIYYVKSNSVYAGVSYAPLKVIFIQDKHADDSWHTSAHELGHQLGIGYDVSSNAIPGQVTAPGFSDRLMWFDARPDDPCRLIRSEWKTINKTARGASQ